MAFPVTLNGRTYTLADFEGTNYVDGLPDAFEDFVTHAGDIYNSTSTSSVAIGTGSKSFTTAESGKPYQAGTPLRIADAAAPETNFLDCIVTSYSGTALVVDVFGFAGSGTKSSWTINIGGAKTVDGTLAVAQGGTGAASAADARTNIDVYSKSEADSKFLDVSGEASNVTMTGDVTIGDTSGDTLTVNATATFVNGVSFGDNVISGDDIDGGTISNFASTGIDDNATSTQLTITNTSASFTGDLAVDTDTLFVDVSAGRVGIGDNTPNALFHVAGGNEELVRIQGTDAQVRISSAATGEIDFQNVAGGGSFTFTTGGSESFRVDENGNVEVTNGAFSVSDEDSFTDFSITNTGNNVCRILFGDADQNNIGQIRYDHSTDSLEFRTSNSEAMRLDSAGDLGINITNPTEKLHVGGNILATGNITAYSDERLKSDIETLDGSKVYEMRGVSFTKDGESGSGVIAQELQKVSPELVSESGDYLSVAYGNLVGYLIEAVKELKSEIDELKGAK